MKQLERCTRCVMPETWANISFNSDGVCSLCQEYDKAEQIDWEERQRLLKEILDYYKSYAGLSKNKYNCIVGVSGGKDTIYTLWAMVRKYLMKPLVVTFDHGFRLSPEGEWNLSQIPKMLDCDHLRFSIGNRLRNALCRKGSEVIGDFCAHCHLGVGAFPARISKMFNIPLQIWGEPSALYQTTGNYKLSDMEEQDKTHFESVFQAGFTPKDIVPLGYDMIDLQPMTWPNGNFSLKAIYLGNFEPWSQEEHVKIIKQELGWRDYPKEETWQSWDKNDCCLERLREAQKKLRRGFGKASFAASKEIREGRITRGQGLELVEVYENKQLTGLDEMCQEMGFEDWGELKAITNLRI